MENKVSRSIIQVGGNYMDKSYYMGFARKLGFTNDQVNSCPELLQCIFLLKSIKRLLCQK